MDKNFTGLNSSAGAKVTRERMNIVASHIFSQYAEYKNCLSLTREMFDDLCTELEAAADFFKQSFVSRGVSSEDIFCKIDENSALLSVMWRKIGFTIIMNDKPQFIRRPDKTPEFKNCCRILAIDGDCFSITESNPENYVSKLIDAEVASLYVSTDEPCEIRTRHISNNRFYVAKQDAVSEFMMKVIEMVYGGGLPHPARA